MIDLKAIQIVSFVDTTVFGEKLLRRSFHDGLSFNKLSTSQFGQIP
jgi:hypothetical protein